MEPKPPDKDNTTFRSCLGMLALSSARVILGIIGVILTTIVSLFLSPSPIVSPNFLPWLLLCFVTMMSIFVGIDYLTSRFIGKPLKLPFALRSIGCFAIVFVPTLAFTTLALVIDINTFRPFILPHKPITSFKYYDNKDNIMVGADLHLNERLRKEMRLDRYGNWPTGLLAAELAVLNDTENPIEITPANLTITYNGQLIVDDQPIEVVEEVVEYRTILKHLTSPEGDLVGPAAPHEIPLLSPLILINVPGAYLGTKQMQDSLKDNEFNYGQIAPSQTRHGFVYFIPDVCKYTGCWLYDAFRSTKGWELKVVISHSFGEASRYLFAFDK